MLLCMIIRISDLFPRSSDSIGDLFASGRGKEKLLKFGLIGMPGDGVVPGGNP